VESCRVLILFHETLKSQVYNFYL